MANWLKVTDDNTIKDFKKYVDWKKLFNDDCMLSGLIKLKSDGLIYSLLWDKYTNEIFILQS